MHYFEKVSNNSPNGRASPPLPLYLLMAENCWL